MDDQTVKAHLHDKLRGVREALVWKLEGLSDHDVRRPMTPTGTNLLGLVKHNALSDARYFGEVFDRTPPLDLPPWDTAGWWDATHRASEHESRADILDLYRTISAHVDATVEALPLDAPGYVPWWDERVMLLNVMAAPPLRRHPSRRPRRHPPRDHRRLGRRQPGERLMQVLLDGEGHYARH